VGGTEGRPHRRERVNLPRSKRIGRSEKKTEWNDAARGLKRRARREGRSLTPLLERGSGHEKGKANRRKVKSVKTKAAKTKNGAQIILKKLESYGGRGEDNRGGRGILAEERDLTRGGM